MILTLLGLARSFLSTSVGRYALTALGVAMLAGGIWAHGYHTRGRLDESDRLKAVIATMTRDAAIAEAAAADDEKRLSESEALVRSLQTKVDDYAKSLSARPECVLGPDDLERLRGLDGAPGPRPKPAGPR